MIEGFLGFRASEGGSPYAGLRVCRSRMFAS